MDYIEVEFTAKVRLPKPEIETDSEWAKHVAEGILFDADTYGGVPLRDFVEPLKYETYIKAEVTEATVRDVEA